MTDYPTVVEVLAIHDDQIGRYGGVTGVRDRGLLEAALFRPQTGYYANLLAELAALWESLAQNHPRRHRDIERTQTGAQRNPQPRLRAGVNLVRRPGRFASDHDDVAGLEGKIGISRFAARRQKRQSAAL